MSLKTEIAHSTPSTSLDENHLSSSDSKETVGSSGGKMKYADEELLSDSSDTKESEGYRLTDVKYLSTRSQTRMCVR